VAVAKSFLNEVKRATKTTDNTKTPLEGLEHWIKLVPVMPLLVYNEQVKPRFVDPMDDDIVVGSDNAPWIIPKEKQDEIENFVWHNYLANIAKAFWLSFYLLDKSLFFLFEPSETTHFFAKCAAANLLPLDAAKPCAEKLCADLRLCQEIWLVSPFLKDLAKSPGELWWRWMVDSFQGDIEMLIEQRVHIGGGRYVERANSKRKSGQLFSENLREFQKIDPERWPLDGETETESIRLSVAIICEANRLACHSQKFNKKYFKPWIQASKQWNGEARNMGAKVKQVELTETGTYVSAKHTWQKEDWSHIEEAKKLWAECNANHTV
jgi:hypothetical protein